LEQFRGVLDRCQGITQFVRQSSQEYVLAPVCLAQGRLAPAKFLVLLLLGEIGNNGGHDYGGPKVHGANGEMNRPIRTIPTAKGEFAAAGAGSPCQEERLEGGCFVRRKKLLHASTNQLLPPNLHHLAEAPVAV